MSKKNFSKEKALTTSAKGNLLQRFKSANKSTKIVTIAGLATLAVLLLLYLIFTIYFTKHFYFGTKINNFNCSGMTAKKAENKILTKLDSYTLLIEEAYDEEETITADEINMDTVLTTDLSTFKKKQHAFAWPVCLFKKSTYAADIDIKYDEAALSDSISKLNCMKEENMKEPLNASIEYDKKDKKYIIVDEQPGTIIDKTKVAQAITEAIDDLESKFNMRDEGCYQEPSITAESEEIKSAVEKLNSYSKSVVTYNILDNKETVDSSKFHDWITWNEKFEISFNTSEAKSLVSEWASKYNTSGKPKTLDTSYGTQVTITSGNYGWKINVDDTTAELIDAIKTGGAVEKEPIYLLQAAQKGDPAKDYGNSYVEINLGTQHLFLYINGSLVIETDFVSGRVTNGNSTPVGIYPITYKQSPAVLKGDNYRSPVTYWMPFNGGVGMHDATWRSKFGGQIYYNSGSHGCINLPLAAAKTIYQNVTAGMPVIVYDEKVTTVSEPPATLSPEEQLAAEMEQSLDGSSPVDTSQADPVDVSNNNNNNTTTQATPNPATPVPATKMPKTPTPAPTTKTPAKTNTPAPTTKTPNPTTIPASETPATTTDSNIDDE